MVYMTGFGTKVIFKVRICGRFFSFRKYVMADFAMKQNGCRFQTLQIKRFVLAS